MVFNVVSVLRSLVNKNVRNVYRSKHEIVHKHSPTSHLQDIVIESDNRSVYETPQSMKRYFKLYDTGVTSPSPPSLYEDYR